MKDWWKKRKEKKAAKKQAKALQKQQGPGVYEDKHMSTGPTQLGTDTANRVYSTQTKGDLVKPGTETKGYFKPDQDMAPAKNAVGASKVASGLGMNDIIPDTRFAKLKTGQGKGGKEVGALSKGAKGEALNENVFDNDITEQVRKKDGSLPKQSEMSDLKKRKGDKVMEFSGTEFNDMDLSRPNTQQGLNRLQWFDSLIGNLDRHGGNILVDPETGDVSGIDNDLSFGRGIDPDNEEHMEMGDGGKFLGMPDLIDEETSERLLGLDRAQLTTLLGQKHKDEAKLGSSDTIDFSEEEVENTFKRLERIQAKIRKLQESGSVVKQWDQSTYDLQIKNSSRGKNWRKDDLPSSYIGRHHLALQEAKDTSVDWKWRKGKRGEDTTPAPQPNNVPDPNVTQSTDDVTEQKDLAPSTDAPTTNDAPEEETKEVENLIGEPLSIDEALAYIDEMIAEFESLTNTSPPGEDQKDMSEVPSGSERPSVPNTPSSNLDLGESSTEEDERKARFREAMSKFANV